MQLAILDQVLLDQSLPRMAADLLTQLMEELPNAGFLAGLAMQADLPVAQ
jgi:hypothetical protein